MKLKNVGIIGVGSYKPEKILKNSDFRSKLINFVDLFFSEKDNILIFSPSNDRLQSDIRAHDN